MFTWGTTHGNLDLKWRFEVQLEDRKAYPDRPMPYSTVGAVYRPVRARVEFTAGSTGMPVNLSVRGFNRDSWPVPGFYGIWLHGFRVKKDGTVGVIDVTEKFYRRDQVPEPYREIVEAIEGAIQRG